MSQPASLVSNAAFISYPKQAAFGRTLPKNKIYEHSGANTRLKDLFVEQVEQIIWQYKLAPETINLPAKAGVPELQIFSIQLKTPDLNLDVLRCIDGAVQFPIIFELSFDGRTQVIAAYKRPNESDASRWVLSDYFATAWLPSDIERAAMPLALDLGGLYEQVLHRLIPTPARPQESLADLVARVELVAAKRREVEKASSRLAKEKQFNRKVEINAHLRQLKNELEELTGREGA
ncbi:hypothetical protein HNQ59_002260 [Chitinivorax tropicus]|uniref:DUF4391 domain-containing protein n=1 Tax=Chitinivorax tropicus TaxID=714531 RepID=A0A840MRT9_9PROT|nr:DUF4391 domain-containing protein [Chitinivorax tropicus]MBB5018963.1 hypothetical protein [Chitinivorax tropicus]